MNLSASSAFLFVAFIIATASGQASCPDGINESGLADTAFNVPTSYTIGVSAGQGVECKTSGGSGNVDLAVSLPLASLPLVAVGFSCLSEEDSNEETCATPLVTQAGIVDVDLFASADYSGVSLVCTCVTEASVPQFSCPVGIDESGLAGTKNSIQFFSIAVLAGQGVECTTSGGTGNVDLLLTLPLDGTGCVSEEETNEDTTCATPSATQAGTVIVALGAFDEDFEGVSLVCTCFEGEGCRPGYFFFICLIWQFILSLFS